MLKRRIKKKSQNIIKLIPWRAKDSDKLTLSKLEKNFILKNEIFSGAYGQSPAAHNAPTAAASAPDSAPATVHNTAPDEYAAAKCASAEFDAVQYDAHGFESGDRCVRGEHATAHDDVGPTSSAPGRLGHGLGTPTQLQRASAERSAAKYFAERTTTTIDVHELPNTESGGHERSQPSAATTGAAAECGHAACGAVR